MKNILSFFIALICLVSVSAQSVPQKINYQAVAHDASGDVLANQSLSVTVQILSGSTTGTLMYEESHTVTTNQYGLFYFKIGEGVVSSGAMNAITWETADHFVNINVNGNDLGTTQLVSVPYALASGSTSGINGVTISNNTVSAGDVLVFNGVSGQWEAEAPSTGGANGSNSIITASAEPPGANCVSGGTLVEYGTDDDNSSVLDAGEVDGSYYVCNGVDGIAGVNGFDGNTWTTGSGVPSGGVNAGDMYLDVANNDFYSFDGSVWNLQGNLSSSETITTLVDNGDSTYTYTNENSVAVIIDLRINDADADPLNEIQDLSFNAAGDSLLITNGVGLQFSTAIPAIGEVLSWDGSNWTATVAGVNTDAQNISFNATMDSIIIDNGTGIQFTTTVPTVNQVLQFDGTNWTAVTLNVDDADADPLNEIQDLSFNAAGDSLLITNGVGLQFSTAIPAIGEVLSWDGSNWTATAAGVNTDAQNISFNATMDSIIIDNGTGIQFTTTVPTVNQVLQFDGTNWTAVTLNVDDADADPLNEIQDLSFNAAGDSLLITNGVGLQFSTAIPAIGEVLSWDGSNWTATAAGVNTDAQNISFNATMDSIIIDNGTGIQFTTTVPTVNQVLQFDGTNWTAVTLNVDDADADPLNEIQDLSFNAAGDSLLITNGLGLQFSTAIPAIGEVLSWDGSNWTATAAGVNTDAQNISFNATMDSIIIDNGTGIQFTTTVPTVNQVLQFDGTNWTAVTLNVDDADADPLNEIQDLSFNAAGDSLLITNGVGLQFSTAIPAIGEVLSWDGSNWTATAAGVNTDAQNISFNATMDSIIIDNGSGIQFTTTVPTVNQVLQFDGTNWTAVTLNVDDADADPLNEIQDLSFNAAGDSLLITNGVGLQFSTAIPAIGEVLSWDGSNWTATAAGVNTDAQNISFNATMDSIIIDNGSGIQFTTTVPTVNQVLQFDGTNWTAVTLNVDDADADPLNEIQDLSFNAAGDSLLITNGVGLQFSTAIPAIGEVLSWDGSNWTATAAGVNTDAQNISFNSTMDSIIIDNGTGVQFTTTVPTVNQVLQFDGTNWTAVTLNVDDADADPLNEIQDLSFNAAGDSLLITNGVGLQFSTAIPAIGEVLSWDGSNWTATAAGVNTDAQNISFNATMDSIIIDNGTGIQFTTTVPTVNQVLQFDGTNWTAVTLNVDDADADPLNEIQDLSFNAAGDSLLITNGVGLQFSTAIPSIGEVLSWDGSNWTATAAGVNTDAQNISFNATMDSIIIDNGTGIQFTTTVPTVNQVLQFDGTNWTAVTLNVDDADADPTNEWNTNFALNGTLDSLVVQDAGGQFAVALTDLNVPGADEDPTNEWNTSFALNATLDSLVVQDAGGQFAVALTDLNVPGADEDPTNEWNTNFALNGTLDSLVVQDAGGQFAVALTDLNVPGADEDPTNEWNTNFALNGTLDSLVVQDAGGQFAVALTDLNVPGADEDPTNEWNTNFALNGTLDSLVVQDAGGQFAVALTDLDVPGADEDPTNEWNTSFALNATLDSLVVQDAGGQFAVALTDLDVPGADEDPTNEWNTSFALNATLDSLVVQDAGGQFAVALTDLDVPGADEDPTNEWNTSFALNATLDSLVVQDAGGQFAVALTDLDVPGADEDPTNEWNTSFALNATLDSLVIQDAGGQFAVALTDINIAGTDDQNISGSNLAGSILTIGIENGASEAVDLSTLSDGNGIYDGSGSTPSTTAVTITDNLNFDANTLYIDATTDNIGIGTNSPQTRLHIVEDGADAESVIQSYGGDSRLFFLQAEGTAASPTPTLNGSVLGSLVFYGEAGAGPMQGADISTYATENWSAGGYGTGIAFSTVQNGNTTVPDLRMVIDNGGFVGINESVPSATLDVVGTLQYVDGNENAGYVLTSDAAGNATWQAAAGGGTAWDLLGNAGTTATDFVGTTDGQALRFKTNNVQAMYIDQTTQNVGIGTENPLAKLHVLTQANNNNIVSNSISSVDPDHSGSIGLVRARGSLGAESNVLTGDRLGQISFNGYNSGSFNYEEGAYIAVTAEEDFTSTGAGSKMSFHTASLGGTTTEAMIIDANQNVGIGESNPLVALHVSKNGPAGIASMAAGTHGELTLLRSNGSIGGRTEVQVGDEIGKVNFIGYNSVDTWASSSSQIKVEATENYNTTGYAGGRMLFEVAQNLAAGVLTPLILEENGDVVITNEGQLVIPTGAGAGLVLTSDAAGNATWGAGGGSSLWTDAGAQSYLTDIGDDVGIGTTNPLVSLHIAREGAAQAHVGIMTAGGNNSTLSLLSFGGTLALPTANAAADDLGSLSFNGHDGTNLQEGATIKATTTQAWAAGSQGTKLTFHTTPDGSNAQEERLVLDQNGNVGIGELVPFAKLHVATEAPNNGILSQTSNNTNAGGLYIGRTRGTIGSQTGVVSGDELGHIGFIGHDGTSIGSPSALVVAEAEESFAAGAKGAKLIFQTTPIGSATSQHRMSIDNAGNVAIGTNFAESILSVNGDITLGERTPMSENAVTVFLTNATGAPSVKGDVVIADPTTDGAFITTSNPGDASILGVVFENGAANGAPCMVAVSGIVTVNLAGAAVRGQHCVSGGVLGGAVSVATPGSGTSIGVFLESAGGGAAKVLLR